MENSSYQELESGQIVSPEDQATQIQTQQDEQEAMLRDAEQYGGSGSQQSNDFSRWQLDTSEIVEFLRENFAGVHWDKITHKYVQKAEPIMNKQGVDAFTTLLQSHLSHVMTLSNFDIKEIKRMALEIRLAVIHLIFEKHTAFEVDKAYYDTIVLSIDHLVYSILKRALNAGEREGLKVMRKSVEQFVQRNDMNQKGGLFSWFRR